MQKICNKVKANMQKICNKVNANIYKIRNKDKSIYLFYVTMSGLNL